MISGRLDLCRPCMEHMRGGGEKLEPVRCGSDYKITCSRCGRRRYGATYVRVGNKKKA